MKKVLVGMFALVVCAGMAMAHINSVLCPKCGDVVSTTRVKVKEENSYCNRCSKIGDSTTGSSLCSKCVEKEKQCEIIGKDAANGKKGASDYYFSSGCFTPKSE